MISSVFLLLFRQPDSRQSNIRIKIFEISISSVVRYLTLHLDIPIIPEGVTVSALMLKFLLLLLL